MRYRACALVSRSRQKSRRVIDLPIPEREPATKPGTSASWWGLGDTCYYVLRAVRARGQGVSNTLALSLICAFFDSIAFREAFAARHLSPLNWAT